MDSDSPDVQTKQRSDGTTTGPLHTRCIARKNYCEDNLYTSFDPWPIGDSRHYGLPTPRGAGHLHSTLARQSPRRASSLVYGMNGFHVLPLLLLDQTKTTDMLTSWRRAALLALGLLAASSPVSAASKPALGIKNAKVAVTSPDGLHDATYTWVLLFFLLEPLTVQSHGSWEITHALLI
jgi:hypothetical protein